jgi:hypothetical protein
MNVPSQEAEVAIIWIPVFFFANCAFLLVEEVYDFIPGYSLSTIIILAVSCLTMVFVDGGYFTKLLSVSGVIASTYVFIIACVISSGNSL